MEVNRRRRSCVSALTLAQLIKYMLEGEHNCFKLADLTGLHYVTVLRYTRAFYREGVAHIAHYDKDNRGCHSIKVYALGPGRDATRPKLTRAQKTARYRAKMAQIKMLQMMAG